MLFGRVVIPEKVFEELSNYENQKDEIDKREWIVQQNVSNYEEVDKLVGRLDIGEAEAIALAKELKADYLIIDERKGRKIATEYGIKIVGLLGVLIQAKEKGHVVKLKPILDKLIDEIGFRVNMELYRRILREVGE